MSVSDQITFRIEPDDEAFQLFVAYKGVEFAGQSSAWFFESQLNDFITRIAAFPIEPEDSPTLAGGVYTGVEVSIKHVYISVRPKGNQGMLLMHLHLAASGDADDLDNLKRVVTANIETTYEKMSELRSGLQSLIEGRVSGAEFEFYPAN